jgi:hypothetical protein
MRRKSYSARKRASERRFFTTPLVREIKRERAQQRCVERRKIAIDVALMAFIIIISSSSSSSKTQAIVCVRGVSP